MRVRLSSSDEDASWDAFVEGTPWGHLLQTARWGRFKSAFGWQVRRVVAEEDGRLVAGAQCLLRRLPMGAAAYVPRGPVVAPDDEHTLAALLPALHRVARQAGAIFLKLEPPWEEQADLAARLAAHGFRADADTVQPRATIVLDITPGADDILAQMKPKWRYNIRLAGRKSVTVRPAAPDDLPAFYELMQVTSRRDRFPGHTAEYYAEAWERFVPSGRGQLLLAEYRGELLAGLMVFACGRTAIYLYGASSDRQRNRMPNHLLQWEAILWARSRGCTAYDLWGIPEEVQSPKSEVRSPESEVQPTEYAVRGDEGQGTGDQGQGTGDQGQGTTDHTPRSTDLWGVYRFKQGFGGRVVRWAGAFDYVYRPWLYWLGTTLLAKLRGRMAL